jgi:hypothetical protein
MAVMVVALAGAVGCDKNAPSETRTGTVASASATAVVPSAPPAPTTASPDFDVERLQKQLKCGGAGHKEACRVLEEFAGAHRWEARIPSGEGRWVGNAYQIEKGADRTELILMSARQVPTNTIGPGDLPLRVGTGPMPDDKRAAGMKLSAALSRGDTVPRGNPALGFAKTWVSGRECSVVNTTGQSLRLVAEHATFVREGAGQKVIIVQPHEGAQTTPGDGTYAEVWPITW